MNAVKWSLLAEAIPKIISPLVVVVLARLLTPSDYGVVAAAVIVISFCRVFWEAGMGKALIQRQSDVEIAADVAFWVNFGLSLVVALSLWALARPVATVFFRDVRVASVIDVLTLQVILGALSSVPTALLQREMKFKRLFWVQLATVAVPAFFSIPLAWSGMGYWALVAGTLAGQAAQAMVLWWTTAWRPSFRFSAQIARDLVPFGVWVAADGLLGWFYLWADSLIVGMFFGASLLGLYRLGNTLVLTLFGIIVSPFTPVIYSALSRACANNDKRIIRESVIKSQSGLFAIALPAGIGFVLFGDTLHHVIGQQWLGIGPVVAVLGMMHGLSWLTGINADAYKAIGRPDIYTRIMAFALLYHIPTYYLFAQHGLAAFLYARIALMLVTELIHFYVQQRCLGIAPGTTLGNSLPTFTAPLCYVPFYLMLRVMIIRGTGLAWDMFAVATYLVLVVASYCVFLRKNPVMAHLLETLGSNKIMGSKACS